MPVDVMENTASVEEVLQEVAKVKTRITEAVDDGIRSAFRAIKQGRHAAEDALDDAKHAVRKNPIEALGVIFAAGMAVGAMAVWIGMRRVKR